MTTHQSATHHQSLGTVAGWTLAAACIAGTPFALAGCNDSESHTKTTTSKTIDTPTEKTKTTTTTEKTVETQKKP